MIQISICQGIPHYPHKDFIKGNTYKKGSPKSDVLSSKSKLNPNPKILSPNIGLDREINFSRIKSPIEINGSFNYTLKF